jgi:branched-chain amino acid transport system ATP-binding protein
LDEPSAGLTGEERADMTRFIKEVKQRFKVSTIWIEHDIKMVGEIADKVVVLDYGRLLADGLPDVVLNDPEVIKAYLGTGIKLKKMKDLHVSNN